MSSNSNTVVKGKKMPENIQAKKANFFTKLIIGVVVASMLIVGFLRVFSKDSKNSMYAGMVEGVPIFKGDIESRVVNYLKSNSVDIKRLSEKDLNGYRKMFLMSKVDFMLQDNMMKKAGLKMSDDDIYQELINKKRKSEALKSGRKYDEQAFWNYFEGKDKELREYFDYVFFAFFAKQIEDSLQINHGKISEFTAKKITEFKNAIINYDKVKINSEFFDLQDISDEEIERFYSQNVVTKVNPEKRLVEMIAINRSSVSLINEDLYESFFEAKGYSPIISEGSVMLYSSENEKDIEKCMSLIKAGKNSKQIKGAIPGISFNYLEDVNFFELNKSLRRSLMLAKNNEVKKVDVGETYYAVSVSRKKDIKLSVSQAELNDFANSYVDQLTCDMVENIYDDVVDDLLKGKKFDEISSNYNSKVSDEYYIKSEGTKLSDNIFASEIDQASIHREVDGKCGLFIYRVTEIIPENTYRSILNVKAENAEEAKSAIKKHLLAQQIKSRSAEIYEQIKLFESEGKLNELKSIKGVTVVRGLNVDISPSSMNPEKVFLRDSSKNQVSSLMGSDKEGFYVLVKNYAVPKRNDDVQLRQAFNAYKREVDIANKNNAFYSLMNNSKVNLYY